MMWRYVFAMALRQMAQHRGYAAITIGGLSLGLAGCLMILGYVRYEQSYDSWLAGSDHVYQVQSTLHPPGQGVIASQATPYPLLEQFSGGFPQVAAIASLEPGKTVTERDGQPVFLDVTTVDGDFFTVFPLPFAQGEAGSALPDTNSVVLTEREAVRQFGTADALGKTISLGAGPGKRDYRVGGVLRDLPRNSSLRLGILFLRDPNQPAYRGWGNFNQQHFVRLRNGADSAAAINAALPAWEKRAIPTEMIEGKPATMSDFMDFHLEPIGAVHLGDAQVGAMAPGGDPRALATFGIVALLTLGMAVMNFINLSTARAVQRAREVALRKLLGASRSQLIVHFLAESVLMSGLALLIALAMVELAMPWIGALVGADLHFAYLGSGGMALPALGLFAATALAGGIYPAIYLSRFRPAPVLHANRASAETPWSGRLRTALVVVQFAIAIGLIASTAIIYSQTRYIERIDPGYRRDGLIQIANAWRFTQGSEFEAARAEILKIPGVTGVARTGAGVGATDKAVRLVQPEGAANPISMSFYSVDADFLQTMEIAPGAGRLLGDRFASDRVSGEGAAVLAKRGINVVLNRAAATKLGYRAPAAALGQTFGVSFDGFVMVPATVVGVVGDTRFGTAREAIDPIVYSYDPEHTSQVVVRYTAAAPGAVMAGLNKVWRRFEPEIPFEARFVDDIVRELYVADRARGALFAGFAVLAVVIACLGLYSLASFATARRTREIGIRKVVGARVRDIVRLLVWQFSKPVVIANLIAWPVASWAMRDWLNGFDARIGLGPGPFALAGLLALAIAIATVAAQSIRTARTNPIHALRYE